MRERSEASSADEARASARRRWREGWIILATGLAVVLLAIVETRPPAGAGHAGGTFSFSDAIIVGLLQVNLILLVLLVFLVARNIVKLVLDRRQRILGSHLRTRLVVAFVAIALLPTTLLFVTAQVLMSNSIERWFDGQVEQALEGSLDVANAYYQDLAADSLGFARKTASQLVTHELLAPDRRPRLKEFLAARRDDYQVDLIEVFAEGQSLARARRADLVGRLGVEPFTDLVQQAMRGAERTAVDAVGEGDVIRAATPVVVDGSVKGVVVVDALVPKSVMKRRAAIDDSFRAYLQMKVQRRPITTNYTITLLLVTTVVLFSATWVGFYVARGITVPIQRLAEGTRAVAQGDLEQRIPGEGDDEIGTLVTSFNHMTADLKRSRTELDARRRYLEIVLANITAGVISADATGAITTMNRAAASLLGVSAAASIGRRLAEVFTAPAHAEIRQMVADLVHDDTAMPPYASVERHLELARDGREVAVLLTGTRLVDEAGTPQGVVLFLEDVTHLLRVERMEAWREVARRIAHEIKNPLTPIQLAAQRLRRRYAHSLEDGEVLDDCTRTIIQQVDDLKNLVNEFSTFARMPAAEHAPHDLNALVDETLVLFREAHREVEFASAPGGALPVLELDREGVRRGLINILDNAVAACLARGDYGPGEQPRIEIGTWHDAALGMVRVEIADNGVGMTAEVRARIFEPYFSTKADGTGLGMAIVSAIVADHNGFIRVRDNQPRGTRFIVEFPVRRQAAQLAARARYGAYGEA